jgi:hypothetical protein
MDNSEMEKALIEESIKAAGKILFTAFSIAELKNEIKGTLDFGLGGNFRLEFKKINDITT